MRLASLLALAAMTGAAQEPATPHFDVASVRIAAPDAPRGFHSDPGRITYGRVLLATLISDAYDVDDSRVQGPDWLHSQYYTVSATMPPATFPAEFPRMMANLLAERFHLSFHRVTRQENGFELVVAPNGPKLTPAAATQSDQKEFKRGQIDSNGFPITRPGSPAARLDGDLMKCTCSACSLHQLADELTRTTKLAPGSMDLIQIVDKTGITGKYDFHLSYEPERQVPIPASLRSALQQQLGLRLNPTKIDREYIVVDRADRIPTDN